MTAKAATPQVRDPERTKAEIIEVATREFAGQGFAGARVDEIAAKTRTTKRMIYYYFGGKEGLFLAVLERAYRHIRSLEQQLDVDHLDPVDAVRQLAELTSTTTSLTRTSCGWSPSKTFTTPSICCAPPHARRLPHPRSTFSPESWNAAAPPVSSVTTWTPSTSI